MSEPRSSLEYWEERWAKDPWNFATSWPDTYARLLELAMVKKYLGGVKGSVFDFGCGNFQLGEDALLAIDLAERGYFGVDGSEAATDIAGQRLAIFANADVVCEDFTEPEYELPVRGFEIVISKRVLQNLTPQQRQEILPQILRFKHGILIEGTVEHLHETNVVRDEWGLEPCTEPAFNWYLNDGEVEMIQRETEARIQPFLSTYYLSTRGLRNLREWDSMIHRGAYKLAFEEIQAGKFDGHHGPVVALTW